MSSYSTNEFKSGLKILLEGEPYAIVENEMVKPGKGQAFNRVKVRNLKTGRVVEKTWKSGDSVDAADVVDADMQYLYTDGSFWTFMATDGTYEQFTAGKSAMGESAQWLKDGVECIVNIHGAFYQIAFPLKRSLDGSTAGSVIVRDQNGLHRLLVSCFGKCISDAETVPVLRHCKCLYP